MGGCSGVCFKWRNVVLRKSFVGILVLCVFVSFSKSSAHASENYEVVASVNVSHEHTGTSGSCYSTCTSNRGSYVGICPNSNYDHGHAKQGVTGYAYKCACGYGFCSTEYGSSIAQGGSHNRKYLSCKVSGNVATFAISKSVGREYVLEPVVSIDNPVIVVDSYTWSSGGQADNSCLVTANGTFVCTIRYSDNGVNKETVLSYTVTDYDEEPPVVGGVSFGMSRSIFVEMKVSATDNFSGVEYYKLESSGQ